MYKQMLNNRLKLGNKKKQVGIKTTKLNLACNEKQDLQNMENYSEIDPLQITEVVKSTPNIQVCSPRTYIQQSNNISAFNSHTNRQKSQSQAIIEPPKQQINLINKACQDYKLKVEQYRTKIQQYKQKMKVVILENDLLKNRQKILQAELNNCSKDYYQRQILRLRGQCQTYQIQNMNIQHTLQSVRNQKNQLETSSKKRGDQIKNYIKLVQKQKMNVIQVKNQLNQKERTYKMILDQEEKSNDLLSKNYSELTEKYSKLQNQIKQKLKIIESLTKHNQIFNNRFKQSDALALTTRKRYEEILVEKQNKILTVTNEYHNSIKSLEQKVTKLNNEILCLKDQRTSNNIQINRISQDIKSQQENMERQLKNVRLSEDIKQLKLTLENKNKIINHFEQKLKDYYSPQQYSNLEKKYRQSQDKRLASAKYYQEKMYNLQKENQKYRLQKVSTNFQSNLTQGKTSQKQGSVSFNEILRKNIQENNKIRQQLRLKIQQNNQLKSQILEIKLKQKKSINDLQILTKRLQSQQKNVKIELQVQQQKYINEIDSLKRKLHTTQTRLQYKTNQNKQKDDFIKNTIIGRTKSSDVPVIINELQRIFLQKQKNQMKNRETLGEI